MLAQFSVDKYSSRTTHPRLDRATKGTVENNLAVVEGDISFLPPRNVYSGVLLLPRTRTCKPAMQIGGMPVLCVFGHRTAYRNSVLYGAHWRAGATAGRTQINRQQTEIRTIKELVP